MRLSKENKFTDLIVLETKISRSDSSVALASGKGLMADDIVASDHVVKQNKPVFFGLRRDQSYSFITTYSHKNDLNRTASTPSWGDISNYLPPTKRHPLKVLPAPNTATLETAHEPLGDKAPPKHCRPAD